MTDEKKETELIAEKEIQTGNESHTRAGALVLWLWGMTHIREVVGLNLGIVYWMNMTFFHIYLL